MSTPPASFGCQRDVMAWCSRWDGTARCRAGSASMAMCATLTMSAKAITWQCPRTRRSSSWQTPCWPRYTGSNTTSFDRLKQKGGAQAPPFLAVELLKRRADSDEEHARRNGEALETAVGAGHGDGGDAANVGQVGDVAADLELLHSVHQAVIEGVAGFQAGHERTAHLDIVEIGGIAAADEIAIHLRLETVPVGGEDELGQPVRHHRHLLAGDRHHGGDVAGDGGIIVVIMRLIVRDRVLEHEVVAEMESGGHVHAIRRHP